MTIGQGIAIFGVWLFAGICGISPTVKGSGFLLAIVVAAIVTILIAS